MKNKKIIVSLLVVVMVLSMMAVCLTACKDKKKVDPNWDDISADALAIMMDNAINNLAPESALLNNTEIAANLNVSATYGEATKNYGIAFAVKLGLNKEDDNTNAFSLVVTDKADNSVAFGAYYDESLAAQYENDVYGSTVYLQGPSNNFLALKGVKVKQVIKDEDATISNSWCEEAQITVLDALSKYLSGYIIKTAGGLGNTKISKDGTVARLELPLTELLKDTSDEGLGGLLESVGAGMVDPYFEKLGIDLAVAELVNVIPELTVALQFTFAGEGFDTTLENIQAELACGAKDFKIDKVNGGTLLEIDIAKDFSATVSADIFVAPEKSMVQLAPSAAYDAEVVNALNFYVKGELTLDQDINGTVGPLTLAIPKGDYNVTLAIDADPTALIGMDFKSTGLDQTLTIIGDVLNKAVDYLLVDVRSKTAAEGEASTLKIELSKNKAGQLIANAQLQALGMDNMSNLPIADAISIVAGLFSSGSEEPEQPSTYTPSGDVSGSTSGNTSGSIDEDKVLNAIKPYIEVLSIIIKGGKAEVALDGAKFDIKDEETGEVTSTATLDASIVIDSNGLAIIGHATGLDKLFAAFPADLNVTIKVTEFKLGAASEVR